jgi:hypothetical protein
MIKGDIILEDLIISFSDERLAPGSEYIQYRVIDSVEGDEEEKIVRRDDFMIALGIALNNDGEIPSNPDIAWNKSEAIQPDNTKLRFIP